MKPAGWPLSASNQCSSSISLRVPGVRGPSIQSTPRAKPGPWKWDLWSSRLITAPIEVRPRFNAGRSQRAPTTPAIWRCEGLWEASQECLRKRHFHLVQPGHLAEEAPGGLQMRSFQRGAELPFGLSIRIPFHRLPFIKVDPPKSPRLNLHLFPATEDSPKHHCELPPTSELHEVIYAHRDILVVSSKFGQRSLVFTFWRSLWKKEMLVERLWWHTGKGNRRWSGISKAGCVLNVKFVLQ